MNLGFFWEAHEAWEEQWHANERIGVEAELLVFLIRCAAVRLKDASGRSEGRDALVASSRRVLSQLQMNHEEPGQKEVCGLPWPELSSLSESWFAGEKPAPWLLPGGGP